MSDPVVVIAMPSGDEVKSRFCHALVGMCTATAYQHPEIKQHQFRVFGSLIPKLRQRLVDDAMNLPGATHVLFLDTDMTFPKDTLWRLLQHGQDAVCAGYMERTEPYRPVLFPNPQNWDERLYVTEEDTGLLPIVACGMGCMLLTTDLLRRIPRPHFTVSYNTTTDQFLGEDIYFCHKIAAAGVQLWCDADLTKEVAHIGSFVYRQENALGYARAAGRIPQPVRLVTPDSPDWQAGLAAAEAYSPHGNGNAHGEGV